MSVAEILGKHQAGNPAGQQEALLSSANMLLRRYEGAGCDNEGVSGCIRCNAVFIAQRMKDLIAHVEAARKASEHSQPESSTQ